MTPEMYLFAQLYLNFNQMNSAKKYNIVIACVVLFSRCVGESLDEVM